MDYQDVEMLLQAILQKKNLCNIIVIVTRYFGGILLGTGGLVRAYSEATISAIENAEIVEFTEGKLYRIKIEYNNFEKFKYFCQKNSFNITKIEYDNIIVCNVEIIKESIDIFLSYKNISEITEIGDVWIKK